jgi:hypothetical protein
LTTVEQLIRTECGDYYEQRRVLLLRLLAALSDPDLRSEDTRKVTIASLSGGHPMTATRSQLARHNEDNLVRLISAEWKGRRGPQVGRLLRRAKYQLIDPMTDDELLAFHADVFNELVRALPAEPTA